MEQSDFSSKLTDTYRALSELNIAIRALASEEEKLYSTPNPTTTDIQILGGQIKESYQSALSKISILRGMVDNLITTENDGSMEMILPSNEDAQNLLKTFIKGKVKLRAPPIPTNAGCYSWKLKTLQTGQFICYKAGPEEYILMVVLSFENETCLAYDPTDLKSGFKELEKDSWIPMPTVLPEKAIARWEFQKNADVLALYPNEGDELGWTTVFYPAKVINRPCDQDNDPGTIRGYDLDFSQDGNDIRRVPEQFVVKFPG
jgi:hypothetical protein